MPPDQPPAVEVRSSRRQLLTLVQELITRLGRGELVGAEIGVALAATSHYLLSNMPGLVLHLVDPWKAPAPDHPWRATGDKRARLTDQQQEQRYQEAVQRLRPFGCIGLDMTDSDKAGRAIFWRKPSVEAAEMMPDACLDFVFIDAAHDYGSVKQDLQAWWPKVKAGGLFSGHDYVTDPNHKYHGVTVAVNRFCRRKNLTERLNVGAGGVWWAWKEP